MGAHAITSLFLVVIRYFDPPPSFALLIMDSAPDEKILDTPLVAAIVLANFDGQLLFCFNLYYINIC